jgi:hypothetical protein
VAAVVEGAGEAVGGRGEKGSWGWASFHQRDAPIFTGPYIDQGLVHADRKRSCLGTDRVDRIGSDGGGGEGVGEAGGSGAGQAV